MKSFTGAIVLSTLGLLVIPNRIRYHYDQYTQVAPIRKNTTSMYFALPHRHLTVPYFLGVFFAHHFPLCKM